MIDTVVIKERVDCRLLIERDLGPSKKSAQGGKAKLWKCPIHHEERGYSLVVYADGWKCWGSCGLHGDAIKWLEVYHHMTFAEACRTLGADETEYVARRQPVEDKPHRAEPPSREWQDTMACVAMEAADYLWSDAGHLALEYLRSRGLSEHTIASAGIGYIRGHYKDWRKYTLSNGDVINVPCGITIPWLIDNKLWGIKVRRAAGDIKYQMTTGSKISGDALYWADNIVKGKPILLTEGEFDCLIAWQQAHDMVSPVTLGSAGNRLNERWYGKFIGAPTIFAAYDHDDAGDKGAAWMGKLSKRVKRLGLPDGVKDVNDLHKLDPVFNVRDWIGVEVD